MDEEFKRIYQRIWERARDPRRYFPYWGSFDARRISLDAVNGALRSLRGLSVRDDAKILLVINIHTLVVLPQLMKDSGAHELLSDQLEEQVQHDVRIILAAASEEASEGEISSAAVIRGLAKVLDKLMLKDARIWSQSNERSE